MSRNSNHERRMNRKQNELNLYDYGHYYANKLCAEAEQLEEQYKDLPEPEGLRQWFNEYAKELEKEAKASLYKARFRKNASRVAALFLILLLVSAAVTMSVEAFRVRFLNFFIEKESNHNVLEFEVSEQTIEWPKEWINFYYPSYIPDGYMLVEAQGNSSMKTILLMDSEGKLLIISQSTGDIGMNLDSEQVDSEIIDVNENEAMIIKKDNVISIIWTENGCVFTVEGEEKIDVMIKIAEKIKKYSK